MITGLLGEQPDGKAACCCRKKALPETRRQQTLCTLSHPLSCCSFKWLRRCWASEWLSSWRGTPKTGSEWAILAWWGRTSQHAKCICRCANWWTWHHIQTHNFVIHTITIQCVLVNSGLPPPRINCLLIHDYIDLSKEYGYFGSTICSANTAIHIGYLPAGSYCFTSFFRVSPTANHA